MKTRVWAGGRDLAIGLLLLNCLLLAPQWLSTGRAGPGWIALESLLVAGLLTILPPRSWSTALRVAAVTFIMLLTIVAFGDAVVGRGLGRPLNLYLDVHLVSAVLKLLNRVMGTAVAVLILGSLALSAVLGVLVLSYLFRPGREPFAKARTRMAGALIALFVAGLGGERIGVLGERITTPALRLAWEQTRGFFEILAERERFATELGVDPVAYGGTQEFLGRLVDHDVVVAFIESYGMALLDDPRFSPVILPRLDSFARGMADSGLHLATGSLEAPTQGGQSWLSHGTLISGLWLDNQLRYDLMMESSRQTLIDDFRRAGHRTVALMPAITLAWPEGERLGYDRIFDYRNLDYAGPRLNWVTMPDQYTWSFLESRIRSSDDTSAGGLFAEVALISSHAPWTPILPVLDDWNAIGDGSIFESWEDAGPRPSELWWDIDRVRQQYVLSVDYAIASMAGFAGRYVDERTLLIVLGDHQAAPLIIGADRGGAVPVHVISRDPDLLEPFMEWGFRDGALPDPNRSPPRMDAFRDWFVRAFSTPVGDATGASARAGQPGA